MLRFGMKLQSPLCGSKNRTFICKWESPLLLMMKAFSDPPSPPTCHVPQCLNLSNVMQYKRAYRTKWLVKSANSHLGKFCNFGTTIVLGIFQKLGHGCLWSWLVKKTLGNFVLIGQWLGHILSHDPWAMILGMFRDIGEFWWGWAYFVSWEIFGHIL